MKGPPFALGLGLYRDCSHRVTSSTIRASGDGFKVFTPGLGRGWVKPLVIHALSLNLRKFDTLGAAGRDEGTQSAPVYAASVYAVASACPEPVDSGVFQGMHGM